IPANDDATKAISLILDYVQAAIEAGQKKVAKPADKAETVTEKVPPKAEEPKADEPEKVERVNV
ncbi:MAG: 30S ribosomal protein S2, partial [Candidatus Saccharimonadales bacterium]